ncbi:MAG: peptidylprolyl isomerase [Halobacteriales archaeon]
MSDTEEDEEARDEEDVETETEGEPEPEETEDTGGNVEDEEAVEDAGDEQAGGSEAGGDSGDDDVEDAIEEGDFVRLEFTARVADEEDGRVIDTTDADVAESEGLETEGREFGPRVIGLGEGALFESVESEIVGSSVGHTGSVVVPSEEAFGEHDPDDVRTLNAQKIPEDDRYPGAQVEVDGRQGFVETIIGGRARVDFNHPLAGDDLEYEFEVVGVVEDELERAAAVIEQRVGVSPDVSRGTETKTEIRVEEDDGEETEVEEEVEVDVLYIEADQALSFNQQWMFTKQQVVDDLMHRFDVDRVVVRETFDHDDVHGGMPGMGGMGLGGVGDVEDLEQEVEALTEESEAE